MRMSASLAMAAFATFASAGDLIIENFTGPAGSTLNGRSPATNHLSPGTAWVADPIFAANGQVNDGTNSDRGAYLDLGGGHGVLLAGVARAALSPDDFLLV